MSDCENENTAPEEKPENSEAFHGDSSVKELSPALPSSDSVPVIAAIEKTGSSDNAEVNSSQTVESKNDSSSDGVTISECIEDDSNVNNDNCVDTDKKEIVDDKPIEKEESVEDRSDAVEDVEKNEAASSDEEKGGRDKKESENKNKEEMECDVVGVVKEQEEEEVHEKVFKEDEVTGDEKKDDINTKEKLEEKKELIVENSDQKEEIEVVDISDAEEVENEELVKEKKHLEDKNAEEKESDDLMEVVESGENLDRVENDEEKSNDLMEVVESGENLDRVENDEKKSNYLMEVVESGENLDRVENDEKKSNDLMEVVESGENLDRVENDEEKKGIDRPNVDKIKSDKEIEKCLSMETDKENEDIDLTESDKEKDCGKKIEEERDEENTEYKAENKKEKEEYGDMAVKEKKDESKDVGKEDEKEKKDESQDITKEDKKEMKDESKDVTKEDKEKKVESKDVTKEAEKEKDESKDVTKEDEKKMKDESKDVTKEDEKEMKDESKDVTKEDEKEMKDESKDVTKEDKKEKKVDSKDVTKEDEKEMKDESKDVRKEDEKEMKDESKDVTKEDKKEKKVESKDVTKEDEKEMKDRGKDVTETDDGKEKPESQTTNKKNDKESEKGTKESESKEGEGGNEMDVDEDETYPAQINFVDVNAPGSPLTIDDDDDDDEVIVDSVKKGSGSLRGRRRNRNKNRAEGSNRDSSPEVLSVEKRQKEIVIDLDDDDIELEAVKRKKKKKSDGPKGVSCCNLECSGLVQDLKPAPVFVLTYYGRKYKKGRQEKVCQECYDAAVTHQEYLSCILSEHKPLMRAKFQPRNDTVVLTDSDEEGSEEEQTVPEEVLQDLQDKLAAVMESTLTKYDIDYQISESETYLSQKLDELDVGFKEMDKLVNDMQKKMDRLRNDLYKDYIPKIQELPGLTIDDSQFGSREPMIRQSPPKLVDFRQSNFRQYKGQSLQKSSSSSSMPQTTALKQRTGILTSSSVPSSPVDTLKKSPLAGVATKKVTQVQRSIMPGPSQPEVQKQEEVVALEQVEVMHKPLPPLGPITRPKPRSGDVMYVMKLSFYGVWARAKVLEVVPKGTELSAPGSLSQYNTYKVKFESSYRKSNPVKQVTGKQMAYTSPSPVRFPVGTRVIAIFQDNDWSKECYYSGVIAEPPKSMNKYRYLVFFDDGYAQYVNHEKILLVCESSRNVWEDIHPDSREFIRKYLEQYPERPMVKLQQGQIVKTEWNGKWWIARVVEVDGSLVKMHFDADGRTEWIYRGSTRLGPLYAELAHAAARKEQGTFSRHRGLGVASLKKRNMPYVEYTRGTDGEELRREDSGDGHSSESVPTRAVAKKSTTKRPESMDRTDQHGYPVGVEKPQGRVEILQLNTSRRPRKFEPHQCGTSCLIGAEYDPKAMKGVNPLIIPMLCAWERQVNRCRGKRVVMYKAPCGRRLRNMEELHRYLRITKSNMAVDLFDFDFWVHCFAEFVLDKGFSNIKDLSYGAEYVPVPCVNCVDHSLPDYVSYSTKREPTDGVDLNLDPEFLTGCDCTDDCQDRDKCACWQLTIQGTAYGPGGVVDPTVGYIYRRLPEPVMTGIYECSSRCKCSNTCLNRVAQQPLQLKLQVFKTENRGWGIRCLNDIPQGGFICIYAGRLLTEQGANEGGKNYGDEYLAELDYIEVVEKLKEGYESDVVEDDDEESDAPSEEKGTSEAKKSKTPDSGLSEDEEEEAETSQDARDSDEEFRLSPWSKSKRRNAPPQPEQSSIRTRLRNRSSRHGSEDSQNGKETDKDKDVDRDSDKASSDDRDSRKSDGHKKAPRSISSDHNYSDDDDSEILRQPSRFAAVSEPKKSDTRQKSKNRSVREFFGRDEYCYIMDAKNNGNIGRYLNHSCSPNVFVQNVFVDTHDLRFPWVAFFALTYIHAGTELTWDYNYDVGSVPGKVLHCYCGSNDCRGRLL